MRTDEQAMWRVKMDDDAEAFADLVARWEKPIQRLCARMLGDIHRGQDLTQEAFARVFARRKNYEPTGKFSTFLWRVALNLCYDELRKSIDAGSSPWMNLETATTLPPSKSSTQPRPRPTVSSPPANAPKPSAERCSNFRNPIVWSLFCAIMRASSS